MKKDKNRYVFLVYCNPVNPLVYGIYLSKKKALKYATDLVEWRRENAKKRGHEFGFYHYFTNDKRKESEFDKKEKTIFSTCLKVGDESEFGDNVCLIKVVRMAIS